MAMMLRGAASGPAKKLRRETLRRIAAAFAPYKLKLIWIALAVLISAGLGILSPFFLQIIVNQGLIGHDLGTVTRYSIYTLAATIGGTVFGIGYGYLSIVVGQRI